MVKISPLLPAPCSPAVLAENETALPLERGVGGIIIVTQKLQFSTWTGFNYC